MSDAEVVQQIGKLLAHAVSSGASDVHLRPDQPPMFRISGDLVTSKFTKFNKDEMRLIADRMTPKNLRQLAAVSEQIDFSAEWQGTARFRVHRFMSRSEPALVLRVIPLNIPSFADLRLPGAIKKMATFDRALDRAKREIGTAKDLKARAVSRMTEVYLESKG